MAAELFHAVWERGGQAENNDKADSRYSQFFKAVW